MDQVRVVRWLCAARIFKSRTLAHDACEAGQVEVNGAEARASRAVRVGDDALLLVLIAIVVIGSLSLLGGRVSRVFSTINSGLNP